MAGSIHYIPGNPHDQGVLSRFLPQFRSGITTQWLSDHISPSGWVVDPFGTSPDLIAEAAQSGRRVLVTANNPITRFILETRATPILKAEITSAVAALATSTVSGERLEPHIRSLYNTRCQGCSQEIQADAFLWEKESTTPFGKIYTCPYCKDSGERPTNQEDQALATRYAKTSGLHHSRALERVAPLHDPDRVHVEEALEVYLPRAIYALLTIINKLEGEIRDPVQHPLLSILLLHVFDRANTIWPHPPENRRPKRLSTPPVFRENNVWLALESAVALWTQPQKEVRLTHWPEPPPEEGGICLFDGRIKELAQSLNQIKIEGVLTTFPRPNQAFWTLSALWSGWLWGHEAVEPYKVVLRRRRYDWSWHATALHAALSNLAPSLADEAAFMGLVHEVEPAFLSAILLAADLAGFNLTGFALRDEESQAQIYWQGKLDREEGESVEESKIEGLISEGGLQYLCQRGEPSSYLYLHAAGLGNLIAHHPLAGNESPGETLSQIQNSFSHAFSYQKGFLRFGGSEKSLDVGQWWIRTPDPDSMPLADQIEISLVDYLIKNPGREFSAIDEAICQSLPGMMPPSVKLLEVCLDSYGEQDSKQEGRWYLRKTDTPSQRRSDISEMEAHIQRAGKMLGFSVIPTERNSPIQWDTGNQTYIFYISASAILGKYIKPMPGNIKPILVLPGSRANLVAYKLKRNPNLQQVVDEGWQLIKYRHIRQLASSAILRASNLDDLLSLDPLTYQEPQMRLF